MFVAIAPEEDTRGSDRAVFGPFATRDEAADFALTRDIAYDRLDLREARIGGRIDTASSDRTAIAASLTGAGWSFAEVEYVEWPTPVAGDPRCEWHPGEPMPCDKCGFEDWATSMEARAGTQ